MAKRLSTTVESPWYSPTEAALYLRMTVQALYKAAQRGRIKAHRLGRHYRFHRRDLDAALKGR